MFKIAVISSLLALCSAGVIPGAGLNAGYGLLSPGLIPSAGVLSSGYGGGYGYAEPIINIPTPYSFGYDIADEYGTRQSRQESGNGHGGVTGSYGYVDGYGISRRVEYIADELGFRATIKTNEPGTETSAPANVLIQSNAVQVPALYAPRAYAAAPAVLAGPGLGLGLGIKRY